MNREQEIVVGRITRLLEIAANPWCVQCHEKMKKSGFDRYGGQRWKCEPCKVLYGYPQMIKDKHSKGIQKPAKFAQAKQLFIEGYSIRQVMRMVGLAKATANSYRQYVAKSVDLRCPCGQPSIHQAWCWWRYQQSPGRQEFMQKWHQR